MRPPSSLKSLSVFAAANTRDRVGRLMPTSLRSTCLVSATSWIPGGAQKGFFAPCNPVFALPGALRNYFSPGKRIIVMPGAQKGFFALGNSISALSGALRNFFALGKRIIVMPGVQKGFFAPGNPVFALPGALRGFSAPGKLNTALLGANDYWFCPWRRNSRRQKVFFSELGSAAGRGGSGEGSAAAGSVGNGSGSRGSGKRGWKPSRTLPTGKRDNATETKQNLPDRQTG